MELLTLLFLLSPILLFILSQAIHRRNGGKLPPGPRPLPIIGNIFDLGDKPHYSLAGLAKTHGPLMSLQLGNVTTIVISSPEAAREVLQKNDQAFSGRSVPDILKVLNYHDASLIWQHSGPQWRNLRRICNTQLFMSQKLKDSQDLRQNKVRDVVAYVKEQCLAGEAVDIGLAAFTVVMNTISNTVCSVDMVDIRSDSAKIYRELVRGIMVEAGKPNVSDFFPVLAAMDLQGRRRKMASWFKILDGVFDGIIDGRMLVKGEGYAGNAPATNDFLDSLIESNSVDNEFRLDRHAMRSLLKDLFASPTDATTNTIEWAMAELLRNPSAMEKAQAELMQTIRNGKEVEESDIQELPYLQAIVKETFRLHPPVPFLIPHKAETNVELCGYTIPKGTRVLVNVWAMGRDENIWTNSDQFKPERFSGKHLDYKGHDFELIPFGAGRRMCPGLPLAHRMIHLVLASLIHEFNWKLPKGMKSSSVDMTERFGFLLAKATPLQAIPELR